MKRLSRITLAVLLPIGLLCAPLAQQASVFAQSTPQATAPPAISNVGPILGGNDSFEITGDNLMGGTVYIWQPPAATTDTLMAEAASPSTIPSLPTTPPAGSMTATPEYQSGQILTTVAPADNGGPEVVWVKTQAGYSPPFLANTPDLFSQSLQTVVPGEQLRVFGTNLWNGNQSHPWYNDVAYLKNTQSGQVFTAISEPHRRQTSFTISWSHAYYFSFQVPPYVPPGSYTVQVANGTGGAYGLSNALDLSVVKSLPWIQTTATAWNFQTTNAIPIYTSFADAFNAIAISSASNPGAGDIFGGLGVPYSYSAESLQTAGFAPGAALTFDGVHFTWPNVPAGSRDTVDAGGQRIPFSGSGTTLGFLGAATYGNQSGTGMITYTDGTMQSFSLMFPNWLADSAAGTSDTLVASVAETSSAGLTGNQVGVYLATVPLAAGKTIASITLPQNSNLHVFAIGTNGTLTPAPSGPSSRHAGDKHPADAPVAAPSPAPSPVVPAETFRHMDTGLVNATSAIQHALDAAAKAGGGIVALPPGLFGISRTLVIPPGVELHGAGAGATTITVLNGSYLKSPSSSAPVLNEWGQSFGNTAPLIWLQTEDGIANLTVRGGPGAGAGVLIEPPIYGQVATHVFLNRVTVSLKSSQMLATRQVQATGAIGIAFGSSSNGLGIWNSTIAAPYPVLAFMNAGGEIARYARILNDTFNYTPRQSGDESATFPSFQHAMFADNTVNNGTTGLQWYGQSDNWFYNNVFTGIGGEQNSSEQLFDQLHTTFWYAPVASATATTLTSASYQNQTLASVEANSWAGSAAATLKAGLPIYAVIVGGPGFGEYRRVASVSNDTIKLNRPWNITPNATSEFVLTQEPTHNIYLRNASTNTNGDFLTTAGLGQVFAMTQATMSGGMLAWQGRTYPTQYGPMPLGQITLNAWNTIIGSDLRYSGGIDEGIRGTIKPAGAKIFPIRFANLITQNLVTGGVGSIQPSQAINQYSPYWDGRSCPLSLYCGPYDLVNRAAGIDVNGQDNIVENNDVVGLPTGIWITGSGAGNVVRRNQIVYPAYTGILDSTHQSIITQNTIIQSPANSAPQPTTLTVSPQSLTLAPNASHTVTATVYDQSGQPMTGQTITWSSANSKIATVNATGTVTGVSAGSTTITAAVDGLSAKVAVTVSLPPGTMRVAAQSVSSLPGGALALSGNNLFVGGRISSTASQLSVLNPTSLAVVGSVYMPGAYPDGAPAAYGNYVYWPVNHAGLQVVNVSNPADPKVVNRIPLTSNSLTFAAQVAGTDLYVTTVSGVAVFSLANPALPQLLGTIGVPPGPFYAGMHHLYEIPWDSSKLTVINDVYGSGFGQTVGTFDLAKYPQYSGGSTTWSSFLPSSQLYKSGNNLYVGVTGRTTSFMGVLAIDVSNPANLTLSSAISLGAAPPSNTTGITGLNGAGKHLFVAVQTPNSERGLYNIDISNPAQMTLTSKLLNSPSPYLTVFWNQSVAVIGNYVYVTGVNPPVMSVYVEPSTPSTSSSAASGTG